MNMGTLHATMDSHKGGRRRSAALSDAVLKRTPRGDGRRESVRPRGRVVVRPGAGALRAGEHLSAQASPAASVRACSARRRLASSHVTGSPVTSTSQKVNVEVRIVERSDVMMPRCGSVLAYA